MYNKDLLKTVRNSDGKIIKKPIMLMNSVNGIQEYEYDVNGNMICEKNSYFDQGGSFVTKFVYDVNNLLCSKTSFVNEQKIEETIYEYNEKNLLLFEKTYTNGQIIEERAYQYDEKNRKVKETFIEYPDSDTQDNLDSTPETTETITEYITDNHYKETIKYNDGSVETIKFNTISPGHKVISSSDEAGSFEITETTDGNTVTEVCKSFDGTVSETIYHKESKDDITVFFNEKKDKDKNIIEHEKYLYNSDGILECVNIKGSSAHPVDVKDLSVFKKPVVDYHHYKSIISVSKRGFWCSLIILLPLGLLSLALGLVNSIGIMIAAAAGLLLIAVWLIASAPSNIKFINEHKDKLLSYTVDTIDMSFTFSNVASVPGAFEIRNSYTQNDIILPIKVWFSAIKSAEFVKSCNNFVTDKLVLKINDYEPLEIPASKEVLNTLSKFIPVKNYGFFEKMSFIKTANMDDLKELRELCKK